LCELDQVTKLALPKRPDMFTGRVIERYVDLPKESFQRSIAFWRLIPAGVMLLVCLGIVLISSAIMVTRGIPNFSILLGFALVAGLTCAVYIYCSLCLTGFSNAIRVTSQGLALDFRTNGVVPWSEIESIRPYLGRFSRVRFAGLRVCFKSPSSICASERPTTLGLESKKRAIMVGLLDHDAQMGEVILEAAKQFGGARIKRAFPV
jgi:hypothetical protein